MKTVAMKVPTILYFVMIGLLAGCQKPPETSVRPDTGTAAKPMPATVENFGVSPTQLGDAERSLKLVPITTCNLERLDGVAFTVEPTQISRTSDQIRLSGWLANADQQTVPPAAQIRLNNTETHSVWRVGVETGGKRDDVMTLLGGNPAFATPGFSVVINTQDLPAGRYRAYIVFPEGNVTKVCDNGRTLNLQD